MVSILTSAKPFAGYNAQTQTQTIKNWKALGDSVEVIVYGQAPGIEDRLDDLGCEWVPEIQCAESGVPLMPAILEHAREHARHDRQVYVNCDILFTDRLLSLWDVAGRDDCLIVGQRLDLTKLPKPQDWPELLAEVREMAKAGEVSLHASTGSDYFFFRRGFGEGMGRVIIGRAVYDNAMIAYALSNKLPLIDATRYLPAFHLPHDYSHVPDGHSHVWKGQEATQNRATLGGRPIPLVSDTDYAIVCGSVVPNRSRGDFMRHWRMRLNYQRGLSKGADKALYKLGRVLQVVGVSRESVLELNDVEYLQDRCGN